MRDRDKTKEQLIRELAETRRRHEKLKALVGQDPGADQTAAIRGKVINFGGRLCPGGEAGRDDSDLREIFQALPDLYFQLDSQGTILDVQAGQASDLYLSTEMLMGRRFQDIHPRAAKQFDQAIRQALESRTQSLIEYSITRHLEQQFYEARLAPLREDRILMVVRNITERKHVERQLKFLSLRDPLTKLYNRAYFEQEMKRLERGRSWPVGIIVCDVDALKLVNDILGHKTGDEMLVESANIFHKALRRGEVVARIGGDEFAVVLPVSDRQMLEGICDRIRDAVASYNATDGALPLSISIGCAVCSDSAEGITNAFKEADDNMYREKLYRTRTASSAIVTYLMNILNTRGVTTEEQTGRIREFAGDLAVAVGLGRQSLSDLRLLARFHDIGMIGIRGHICSKPGPLTPEETTEMRRHCEIGHRIAQSVPELFSIADGILKHHEWFDGNGYPLGLKGGVIPLECRIMAIAEAFVSMTGERPYRKAMTPEAALMELEKGAGAQFDPFLVSEFIKLYEAKTMKKVT
jgi:diguanylate cyclase (GGDEF)-like protein/PAS domain S-box-containing protein